MRPRLFPERGTVMPINMTPAIPPTKNNKEKGCIIEAGSRESHEPRLIGDVLREYVSTSNEPLAVALRERNGRVKVEQLNADSYGKE